MSANFEVMAALFDYDSLAVRTPQINARGAKTAAVQAAEGKKAILNLGSKCQPTVSPFGATCFQSDTEQTRRTIEFNITPEQNEQWQQFDAWAVDYFAENSEMLFKKSMSPSQVRECYRSPVTRHEGYAPHLRCKINVNQARAWDADGKRIELPELKQISCVPRITLQHAWFMSREWGFVLQVNDIQVLASSEECPFE